MIFGKQKDDIWLIAGLGNPGLEYEKTRHNAGFMAADKIAEKHGAAFNKHKFMCPARASKTASRRFTASFI